MKYWQLDDEMKEKYGPELFKIIELNGGPEHASIDEFILVKVIGEDDYYWTYDLNWEA